MIALLLSRKDKWIDSLQCDVQYGKYLVREFKDEWNINNGYNDFDDVDIDLDKDKDDADNLGIDSLIMMCVIELQQMLELQEQIKKKIFILVMYLVQMKKIRMKMKVRMIMKMRKIMITFLLMRKDLDFVINLKRNKLIFYNMMFILVNL